ncbi:MAG: hypothetical protein AVDCRST_MAG42-1842 [uncultured Chthoniobacterales bacterium]|uniref:Uncharacterized protein n=1 Tax=uncultured Chthoniobacterales bacterium TaxID=1836801 RepID=A0A6J4HY64_9BACT|nr:MAG: hypothetical protein AVDCRST_MAG42-1842 [uncultured Chthoniobacterales bacterium]
MRRGYVIVGALLLCLAVGDSRAEEKQGIRVDVAPHMAENRSDRAPSRAGVIEVDKTMAMKVSVKNTSMKDLPQGSIAYTFIVERWNADEKESYSSYTGTHEVRALRPAEQTQLDVGTYKIGGHRHGTSPRHEDKLGGWKIVVSHGDRKVEFASTPNFGALEERARANP